MKELDDKIREALKSPDNDLPRGLDHEPSIFDLVSDTFRGRNRWLTILNYLCMFVFVAGMIWCVFGFFNAEDSYMQVRWLLGCFYFFGMVFGMKIWYWMELNKNAMLREIKRLELQVSLLEKETSGT